MNSDPFELHAAIKRLERGRDAGLIAALVAIATYSALYGDQFEPHLGLLFWGIAAGAVLLLVEVRNARLDTLRASLRVVLIAQKKTSINTPDM
jgi:hypothetical protein